MGLVRRIPAGFVPEEDQGYIMVNAQLPDAASLERTDAVMQKAEEDPGRQPRRSKASTRSAAISLLTAAYSSNMGFFFVAAEAVGRAARLLSSTRGGVVAALNRAFAEQIPEGRRRGVRAAGDSRPRHRRGLHDAAAGSQRRRRPSIWRRRRSKFIEAARKRPEIGRIATLYRATVPQIYADIDRSKVLKSACCCRT